MPVPILCLDDRLRHFVEQFREQFSKPQFQYFVTVLLGLLLCQEMLTLSGLLRQVADGPGLWGVSRFLSQAPWKTEAVVALWLSRFREQMQPKVVAEQERQVRERPRQRGRPKTPLVTGYLIGDDSTIQKRKGQKMEGLGRHHSTTEGKRVLGHSLVQEMYVLRGRSCP